MRLLFGISCGCGCEGLWLGRIGVPHLFGCEGQGSKWDRAGEGKEIGFWLQISATLLAPLPPCLMPVNPLAVAPHRAGGSWDGHLMVLKPSSHSSQAGHAANGTFFLLFFARVQLVLHA